MFGSKLFVYWWKTFSQSNEKLVGMLFPVEVGSIIYTAVDFNDWLINFHPNCLMKCCDEHRNFAVNSISWKLFLTGIHLVLFSWFVTLLKRNNEKTRAPSVREGRPGRDRHFLGCDVRHTPCPVRHNVWRPSRATPRPSHSDACLHPPFFAVVPCFFFVYFILGPIASVPPLKLFAPFFL